GVVGALGPRVAGAGEDAAEQIGVGDVHLAAVGLDVDPRCPRFGRAGRRRARPLADREQLVRHDRRGYHGPAPAAILVAVAVVAVLGAFAIVVLGAVLLVVVMPRAAHGAFARGDLGAARRRYRVLARLSPTRARRGAARVSIAACWLAAGDAER